MRNMRFGLLVPMLFCVVASAGEKPPVDPEALKAYQTGIYANFIAPGKLTVPSQQLVDIMWEITEQQFKDAPPEAKKLPAGTTEEDVLKKLKERIPGFPCVQATAEEDANFKEGKFEDNRNFIAYMDFMKILTENNIAIPYTLQVMQRDQKAGKLKGARLELAVRFAFMNIAKVYRAAEKK